MFHISDASARFCLRIRLIIAGFIWVEYPQISVSVSKLKLDNPDVFLLLVCCAVLEPDVLEMETFSVILDV